MKLKNIIKRTINYLFDKLFDYIINKVIEIEKVNNIFNSHEMMRCFEEYKKSIKTLDYKKVNKLIYDSISELLDEYTYQELETMINEEYEKTIKIKDAVRGAFLSIYIPMSIALMSFMITIDNKESLVVIIITKIIIYYFILKIILKMMNEFINFVIEEEKDNFYLYYKNKLREYNNMLNTFDL